jgi:hypothetical protein
VGRNQLSSLEEARVIDIVAVEVQTNRQPTEGYTSSHQVAEADELNEAVV